MSVPAATETFVGRATQLPVLRAAVERASSGDAVTVLVSGDAGVGKSRLVEELMRTTRGDGALVLLGRCVDVGDGELAYAPIASALRSLAAQVDEAELDEVLGTGRAELARLVPSCAAPSRTARRCAASSACSASCSNHSSTSTTRHPDHTRVRPRQQPASDPAGARCR